MKSKDFSVVLCSRYFFSVLIGVLFAVIANAAEPVDINVADADTLASVIQGVGVQKAASIVRYRQQNGPFQSIEQLAEVKGIGEVIINRNRDRIVAGKQR